MRSSNDAEPVSSLSAGVTSAFQLFIVEFDLAELSSHFFNQVLGFKRAAEELGLSPRVLLRRDVAASLADPLDAHRVIEFEPADSGASDYRLDVFAESDLQLRSLWDAIESMEISSNDIVLITSSRPVVIYSLGAWLSRLGPQQRPAVFIRFFGHEYLDLKTMDYSKQSWMHRFAARDLALRPGQDRVFFTVNNEKLIAPLGHLCARRVFHMPLPKYYGEVLPQRRANFDFPAVYVHLNMRSGALLNQIESVIGAVLDQCPRTKVLLKYCKNALRPGAEAPLSRDLSARGVELVPSEQSHADHLGTISRSDVVLLPYEATEYIALASGVFAEAAALGKVIVYPAETWMAEQVACGHATGIDFAVASSQEIGAALLRALASLKEMSSVAQARSNAFRAQHSCGRNLDLMLMLAAAGHDMSLPYLPGTSVRFDKPVQSRGYLGRGWSSFEPDGIWTNGPVAELVFCLAHGPTGSLDARLLLTPFFSKGRPQRITISIGEAELGKWSFPVDGEYIASWCRVTVPEHCVANGSLRMRLHVEDPHSPNQVGISNDPRALGVMLHEMRFEPIEAFSDGVASKPSIQPLAPRVSLTESDTPRPARLVSEDFYLRTTNDQTAARLEHLEAEYQRMMSARSVQFGIRIRLIVERLRRLLAP